MIRHVVLFKFHEGVTWDDPRAQCAEAATRQHPAYIPEILWWECGRNRAARAIAYDFAVIGTFLDQAAIARYLAHANHVHGAELWREIADWSVVDFDITAESRPEPTSDPARAEIGEREESGGHATSERDGMLAPEESVKSIT